MERGRMVVWCPVGCRMLVVVDMTSWLVWNRLRSRRDALLRLTEVRLGGLFEMDILILRHEAAPTTLKATTTSSRNDHDGRYSSPSRPMTTMSGVLES
eukprot:scaffold17752_cov80-Skeletonema_marinoi.AAC.2